MLADRQKIHVTIAYGAHLCEELHWGQRAMIGRLVLAAGLALAVVWPVSAQEIKWPKMDFGRYHALVIGNNEYRYLPKLETAVNDAEAVAELL